MMHGKASFFLITVGKVFLLVFLITILAFQSILIWSIFGRHCSWHHNAQMMCALERTYPTHRHFHLEFPFPAEFIFSLTFFKIFGFLLVGFFFGIFVLKFFCVFFLHRLRIFLFLFFCWGCGIGCWSLLSNLLHWEFYLLLSLLAFCLKLFFIVCVCFKFSHICANITEEKPSMRSFIRLFMIPWLHGLQVRNETAVPLLISWSMICLHLPCKNLEALTSFNFYVFSL